MKKKKKVSCYSTFKLSLILTVYAIEITEEFKSETFLEKIGFRNKRKEQRIFEIGTGKLLKCRHELEEIIQESYRHQAVKLDKKEEILTCHELAIDLTA